MYLYRSAKGKDIKSVGKSALHARANKVWNKGYRARVIKESDGQYQLYAEAGAFRAAGLSITGRKRIKI